MMRKKLSEMSLEELTEPKKWTLQMKKRVKNKKKIVLISIVSLLLSISLFILPILSVVAYESIFGTRYETTSWMQFLVEDYEGLLMERSDFQSEDVTLAAQVISITKEIKMLKALL